MAKSDLYKISGHWGHYKDKMFVFGNEETDSEVFALRPMTCPFQYYVYKNSQRSYRDLPMRLGEFAARGIQQRAAPEGDHVPRRGAGHL